MIPVGAACVAFTPPPGGAMSGFAARSEGATGAHDPLTARAVAVGDTALVALDVIGLDADSSARIRGAVPGLDPARVIVAATHTHGGPASMPGRLGADAATLAGIEAAGAEALRRALAAQVPARLSAGQGTEPGFASNRRHAGGPVDRALPVIAFEDADGRRIATLASVACHPVVLGADNRLWTADYLGPLRDAVEAAAGGVCVCATGCCGDVNTGHSAAASLSLAPAAARTFARAAEVGTGIARAILAADLARLPDAPPRAGEAQAALAYAPPEPLPLEDWRAELETADPLRRRLLQVWLDWAARRDTLPAGPLPARVSALDWGGVPILALPGEVFAATALGLRAALPAPAFVLGYADDNPGYIPPAAEYPHGGYEVAEAHRFYGQPAAFAPGGAEALAAAALAARAAAT